MKINKPMIIAVAVLIWFYSWLAYYWYIHNHANQKILDQMSEIQSTQKNINKNLSIIAKQLSIDDLIIIE